MSESRTFIQTKLPFGPPTSKRPDVSIEEKVDRLKLDSQTSLMHSPPVNQPHFGNTMQPISPPSFSRISLVYPEDEIWTRLQIREFLYQFGDICQLEPRLITSLQNVQDNWRIRRLSAMILWQALLIIGDCAKPTKKTSPNDNDNNTNSNTTTSNNTNSQINQSVQTQARMTVNAWGSELGVTKSSSVPTKAQLDRIGELLAMKGMTAHRWQDVAELLAMADFKNLPVPTLTASTTDTDSEDEQDDDEDEEMDDSEDSDEEDDIDIEIKKFRALGRSPLSTKDELSLVQMLLDLLLLDGKIRRHLADTIKDARVLEDELYVIKKTTEAEAFRYNSTRNHLMGRIDQRFGPKDTHANLQQELDHLSQAYEQQRTYLYQSALQTFSSLLRSSNRRLHHLVTPWDGNEYWLFNDLLTPQQHQNGVASEISYWAHGVIAIGHAPDAKDKKRKWWHISGIANIQALEKWLVHCFYVHTQHGVINGVGSATLGSEVMNFRNHLAQRMDYLWLLEHTVYDSGHFA